MIADHVADTFEQDETGKANVASGYTYSGHPVGAAAAIACLKETQRLNVKDNAAARGQEMMAGLEALKAEGLMSALELVADRATKKPLDAPRIKTVFDTVHANGVMVRVSGPNLILSPPLIVTQQDVADILAALDKGLAAA